MEMNYNNTFHFPDRCILNKRLTKVFFTKNFDLTSSEKKVLNTSITKMEWLASIKPANSNIPIHKDTEYLFEEVQLMICRVSVELEKVVKTIVGLFQKHIPYQIVLIIENETQWVMSTCDKRINQNDGSKRTLENHFTTSPIEKSTENNTNHAFVETLSFSQLNKTNLKTVYESFTESIIQLKSSTLTGVFSKERKKRSKQDLEYLLKVESIQTELISLKSQLKKETQLNKRVSLNMEIQQRKQDIENIKHTLIQ